MQQAACRHRPSFIDLVPALSGRNEGRWSRTRMGSGHRLCLVFSCPFRDKRSWISKRLKSPFDKIRDALGRFS